MRYLIVGGNSVAGRTAARAIRTLDPAAFVIATTSGAEAVAGAEQTITGIDLARADSVDSIPAAIGPEGLRALFFTPAFGAIGYPVAATPQTDLAGSLAFSFDPMVRLAERVRPAFCVGYSAFYWLPHTLAAYGSMAYVKIAQEKLAVREPDRFRMIRAGTFASKATRGIGLLLQRELRKTEHAALIEMGRLWKESGRKFGDFFFDFAYRSERDMFGEKFKSPHRPTAEDDLVGAARMVLEAGSGGPPIVNVIGDWVWTDRALPDLPEDTFRLLDRV